MTQQAPYGNQAPVQSGPANDGFGGFSIAAIGVIVGAVLSLASYPMVWYYITSDPSATVNGLGQVTVGNIYEVEFQSSKMHWAVGVTAAVLVGLAIWRLIGKFHAGLGRTAIVIAVIGALGGLFSTFVVADDFSADTGVYMALAGSLISLASVLAMVLAKK